MPEVKFSVEAQSINHARTEVRVGDFVIQYDEPQRIGGTNTGPTPLQYMLGAAASCLNATGFYIAREMGITIRSIKSRVEGSLDTLGYTGRDNNVRAGLNSITLTLDVDSDEPMDRLQEWMSQVKTRCPVSDNLMNPTPMNIVINTGKTGL